MVLVVELLWLLYGCGCFMIMVVVCFGSWMLLVNVHFLFAL
jgi:hypothetical protein